MANSLCSNIGTKTKDRVLSENLLAHQEAVLKPSRVTDHTYSSYLYPKCSARSIHTPGQKEETKVYNLFEPLKVQSSDDAGKVIVHEAEFHKTNEYSYKQTNNS